MTIKTNKPIWGLVHPDLMDKDKVVDAYKNGTNQLKAADIIGCCDRTFRKALRYHKIIPPFVRMPVSVQRVFHRKKRNGNP